METKQIATLLNVVTQEVVGESAIVNEDLSNIVSVGETIFNANKVDAYVKSLINHIGRVIFVSRKYNGGSPKILMDAWEYGSIAEKIRADLPDAQETDDWKLTDGASYDDHVFTAPVVHASFFNDQTTFTIKVSITDLQVKQSFSTPEQLNSFISMIWNEVDKSITLKNDALIDRVIDNAIGETAFADYPTAQYSASSGVKAVNLFYLYKQAHPTTTLTASNCLNDPDFLRYASAEIGKYVKKLAKMSTLFNVGGTKKFTPEDYLHVVLHMEFAKNSQVYLQSSTFHDELVKLPKYEEVAFWQGSGTGFAPADTMKIDIKTTGGHTIQLGGIIGVMFDHECVGVNNFNRRTTAKYTASAEFTNYWNKVDARYFYDPNENFVVFFVA